MCQFLRRRPLAMADGGCVYQSHTGEVCGDRKKSGSHGIVLCDKHNKAWNLIEAGTGWRQDGRGELVSLAEFKRRCGLAVDGGRGRGRTMRHASRPTSCRMCLPCSRRSWTPTTECISLLCASLQKPYLLPWYLRMRGLVGKTKSYLNIHRLRQKIGGRRWR